MILIYILELERTHLACITVFGPYVHHVKLNIAKTSVAREFVIRFDSLIETNHRKAGKTNSKYDIHMFATDQTQYRTVSANRVPRSRCKRGLYDYLYGLQRKDI